MVAYYDSTNFSNALLQNNTDFVKFISNIVRNGIFSNTYKERAELLINALNPNLEILQTDVALFHYETTDINIIKSMLPNFPTITETIKCSNQSCEKHISHFRSINYIIFQTTNGQIQELQEYINKQLYTEKLTCMHTKNSEQCKGFQIIEPTISPVLIFIEVLFWKGIINICIS